MLRSLPSQAMFEEHGMLHLYPLHLDIYAHNITNFKRPNSVSNVQHSDIRNMFCPPRFIVTSSLCACVQASKPIVDVIYRSQRDSTAARKKMFITIITTSNIIACTLSSISSQSNRFLDNRLAFVDKR